MARPACGLFKNHKLKYFLVHKELAATKKKLKNLQLFGTFLLFCRNSSKRKLRLPGAVTAQAKCVVRIEVVFASSDFFSAGFSLRSGRSVLKWFALKVIQSASLPGITNLVFQRFHPPAVPLAWMFAPMLDSMPAQYDLPTAYPEPGPPIRTCTL
jgi:hypothetical protein